MFPHHVHMGKCKNMKYMTLVTSNHCFTRHGVLQEHNLMADKAVMYMHGTMDCACYFWVIMKEIIIPFLSGSYLSVANHWSNEFASEYKI